MSDDVKNEVLAETNKCRAKHNCPPLVLNANISAYAQEWADGLLARNAMEHRSNPKYGENIYKGSGSSLRGANAVQLWYGEKAKYSFDKNEFNPYSGHFTQLIWKSTKEIGIGVAHKGDTLIVVCNYNPSGNIVGKFKENVPPPTGGGNTNRRPVRR